MADLDAFVKQFQEHYYLNFATNRQKLQELYRSTSMLTFEGHEILGDAAIIEKLMALPPQTNRVITADAQPFPGGVLVLITGEMKIDDNEHGMNFSRAFSIIQDGKNVFIHNDIFRLNYG